MGEALQLMRRRPPSWHDIALPKQHDHIKADRTWRTQTPPASWDPGSVAIHMKEYKRLGMRWKSLRPPDSLADNVDFCGMSSRERDCALVTMKQYPSCPGVD
eukprot:1815025-Alexandrium_andersonii.AAC.1